MLHYFSGICLHQPSLLLILYERSELTDILAPQDGSQLHIPSNPVADRRQQTTSDVRPPQVQHQASGTGSDIGRFTTEQPGDPDQTRPKPNRNTTAATRMRRTGTSGTTRTNQTGGLLDASDRAEKKQEQTVDIDNEYFALNPWYNQQKAKPVFGLAAPLPRTVRKGMWWGRGDLRKSLYKVDEEQDEDGIDQHDALDFQKEAGQSQACHTRFETKSSG